MMDPGKDHPVKMPVELTPKQISDCFHYALSILLDVDPERIKSIKTIGYGPEDTAGKSPAQLFIVASPFFYQWYGKQAGLPEPPLEQIDGVPLLFGQSRIEIQKHRLMVHADIIASTYFFTTRYEEVLRPDVRDEHGRFPGRESLAFRAGFIDKPIVEAYARLLKQWMMEAGIVFPWPKRSFSVLLTHDVDHLRQYRGITHYLKMIIAVLRGKRHPRAIWEGPLVQAGLRADPFDNFDTLLEMDGNAQTGQNPALIKRIFFFMAVNPTHGEGSYRIQDDPAVDLLRRIIDDGCDIGLHASYQAGINPRLLIEEKNRLEAISGRFIHKNRHHYLAWREVRDGYWLKKAGLDWDATMGYADQAGFRLGVCRPIPLFDPAGIQYFGIEEHPLMIMEDTLGNPGYMNLSFDEAWETSKKLLHETFRYHGEFVVLWHNSSITGDHGGFNLKLYRNLLGEILKLVAGRI